MLVILPNPIPKLQHTPLPPKCCKLKSGSQLLALLLFSPQTHMRVYQEPRNASTPQATKASNFHVPRIHVHKENTQFSTDQFMECQFQMHEMVQKLVNILLFSFQDLKLNTKDKI